MSNDTPLAVFYYAVSALVCALTAVGLRQSQRKDGTWLPSFAAWTTLKALVFGVFCVFMPLEIKAYHSGDNMLQVAMFLVFPAHIVLSSLVSLLTYITLKLLPKVRKIPGSIRSERKAVRAANAAVLCVGLISTCIVSIVG